MRNDTKDKYQPIVPSDGQQNKKSSNNLPEEEAEKILKSIIHEKCLEREDLEEEGYHVSRT